MKQKSPVQPITLKSNHLIFINIKTARLPTGRQIETILNDARYNFPQQEYYIISASVLAIDVIFILKFRKDDVIWVN